MNLRCIVLKISIGICFLGPVCFAQDATFDTVKFQQHLKQNNLFTEQLVFNRILQKKEALRPFVLDSLKLERAILYYQLRLPDSSKNIVLNISNNFYLSKRQTQQSLSLLLINKEYDIAKQIINDKRIFNVSENKFRNDIGLSIDILKKELNKNDSSYDPLSVSPALFDLKTRYLNPPYYSPAKAGIYSAVVPGLGKLYIGNKNQAITAFIANILLAAQATESYLKAGPATPRFIITASLFSVFYTGNIIGSISMAKKKKTDYFKQIDHEIFNYYSSGLNQSVY